MDVLSLESLQYEKIDRSGVIRLIRLFPSKRDESIKCELSTHDLKVECPSYEALSYCWGNANEKVNITCNDACLQVTTNLAAALKSLRHPEWIRILWIDAICINQNNVEERTQQVSIMRDIYQHARQTVIWLGDAKSDSGSAIDACERLLVAIFDRDAGRSFAADFNEQRRRNPFDIRPALSKGFTMPKRDEVIAISRLLKRSWFERVWVIQEVGSASTVSMICGDKQIDFDVFWLALIAAFPTTEYWREIAEGDILQLYLFMMARNRDTCAPHIFDLLSLLTRTRTFLSTDPRDKVFALYGLTTSNLSSMNLRVDYQLTTAEVFTQVTLAILRSAKDLEILEAPRSGTELQASIPSWVTDWSDPSSLPSSITRRYSKSGSEIHMGSIMSRALASKISSSLGLEQQISEDFEAETGHDTNQTSSMLRLFAASRETEALVGRQIDNKSLCLMGHAFDKILQVCSVLQHPLVQGQDINRDKVSRDELEFADPVACLRADSAELSSVTSRLATYLKTMIEWEDMALSNAESRYPSGESQLEAYWHCLCTGHYTCTYEEAQADFMTWRVQFNDVRRAGKACRLLGMGDSNFGIVLGATLSKAFRNPSKQFRFFCDGTDGRRLVRTAKGYLGLVPREARTGDMIAILKGGRVPFVLRSRGGSWQLIGASYVHGVMHGEAFDGESCQPIRLT